MKNNILLAALFSLFCVPVLSAEYDPGILYGTIRTDDGETLTGFIRWDRNEVSWDDILDGNKELDPTHARSDNRIHYRDREITIFGVTIFRDRDGGVLGFSGSGQAQSGLRMGHIRTLIPDGDDEVILILKSGEKLHLEGGSGDIGEDIREILVDTEEEGIVELTWDDIDEVNFAETPRRETKFGNRLYGTLVTRRGDEYTGFVCWDMDEAYDEDILDGHEDSRKRKIEFKNIDMIERRSSSSSIVTLKGGKKIRLDGTNDVNSGNRGIVITDHNLGRIVAGWDEFDFLQFKNPPEGVGYDKFDGGRRIEGSVRTEDGEDYSGFIKWDDDEEYTWELLNGDMDEVDFVIEFGQIEGIEKSSRNGCTVTLNDGRTLRLRNSNDVNSDNKGIIIETDEGEVIIDWEDFEKVKFSH